MVFPFLQLPREIRDVIYEYVALNNGQPWHIRPTRPREMFIPVEAPALSSEVFHYRMTLARFCRQLRQEYLPVLRGSASVAIRGRFLTAFQDDFIENGKGTVGDCPDNLIVYIGEEFWDSHLGSFGPLLTRHMNSPTFSCTMMVDPQMPASEMESGQFLVNMMNHGFGFPDPTWKSLVRDGLLLHALHNMAFAGQHANLKIFVGGKTSDVSGARQEEIKALLEKLTTEPWNIESSSKPDGTFEISVKLYAGL